LASQNWLTNQKKIENHQILTYLREGREKEFGWLRKEDADASKKTIMSVKERVHLDSSEKDLLVKIRNCTQQYSTFKDPSSKFSPTKDLAHAFGVSVDMVKRCITNQYNNNGSNKRKQRSDAEQSLVTSNKRQTQVWTAKHYFKKQQRILVGGEQLTTAELNIKFNTLTVDWISTAMFPHNKRQRCLPVSCFVEDGFKEPSNQLPGKDLGYRRALVASEGDICKLPFGETIDGLCSE
jgi:hypothetical protein